MTQSQPIASSAQPSVAIVTGASSGIGRQTAIALAAKGCSVVLAARRADRLAATAQACRQEHLRHYAGRDVARVLVRPTDVSVRRQVHELVQSAASELGRLDVMVNNAGTGLPGRVHELDEAELRKLFEVNFYGVFHGCQAAAAVMTRQKSGHILNVASIIGRRGTPFHAAYCATKSAVLSLTESLRVEMMPYHVRVTAVMPALTDTEFFDASGGIRRPPSEFQKRSGLMSARVVGRRIAACVGHDVPELRFTFGGRLLVVLAALWPGLADRIMKIYHDDLARNLK